jgi:hypothetical protein
MSDPGDTFTEVTSRSWISRIGQSIVGVLIGLVMVIASIVVLFWNERRAIQTARSLAEGAGLKGGQGRPQATADIPVAGFPDRRVGRDLF